MGNDNVRSEVTGYVETLNLEWEKVLGNTAFTADRNC
jgi:hypothetical protein